MGIYIVETEWFNGYRCGCCSYPDFETKKYPTLGEALARLPVESPGEDGGFNSYEVTDGSTGEVVAWSKTSWPTGRTTAYNYTRHQGHHPDLGDFDTIAGSDNVPKVHDNPDKVWADILAKIELDRANKRLAEAQENLQVAVAAVPPVDGL